MFGIGYVNKEIRQCSPEALAAALDDARVKETCYVIEKMVKAKEATTDEKKIKWCNDRIGQAKRSLPCITPMAWFKGNKRAVKNAVPSGLNMIDIDHIDNPREMWEMVREKVMEAVKVALVHVTPSTRGLRIIFEQPDLLTIEEAQLELSKVIGCDYDSCTKDLARCSFLVPRDYVLFMDAGVLFGKEDANGAFTEIEEKTTDVENVPAKTEEAVASEEPSKTENPSKAEEASKADEPSKTEDSSKENPSNLTVNVSFSDTFKGIPYSEIIKSLLFSCGYDITPSEGERNVALYALARNLRYICDFNPAFIMSVLPDWGLPHGEIVHTVENAVKSVRRVTMPVMLQNIIDTLYKQYSKPSEQGYSKAFDYVVEPTGLIGDIVKTQPLYLRNAAYLTAIACLGTLFTRLRGFGLGGKVIKPNFMVCIQAPQATGKSFMKDLYELITEPIFKHDEEMRKQLREIRKENRKNSKKEDYDEKEFEGDIRLLPTNTSNRILLERLSLAQKQHLMIMAEEIDSITKAEKTGKWSEKSDIYRLAFDNSKWGQDYANENAFTATVELYLNLLFSGTPMSVNRFFSDIENGLVTRFLFCMLPDNLGQKRPEAVIMNAEVMADIKNKLQAYYDTMSSCKGDGAEIWVNTEQLCKDVDELYEQPQRIQFLCNQSDLCRGIVYRRYSQYAIAIGMVEIWANDGVYTEEIRDRVVGIMNYCTEQLIATYGDELNKSLEYAKDKIEEAKHRSQKTSVLDGLNDAFTYKEYESLLVGNGIAAKNAGQYLNRLCQGGLIKKVSRGNYAKIK